MATVKDFSRLGDIEGVSKYILVRNDGHVISKNNEETVALASAIVTSGKYCYSLADDLKGKRYMYCCVERDSGDNVLIFSLGRYYLGIIKHSDSDPRQLAETIISFLKTLA